ncbi:glutathione S-transferase [Marasmius fiardii PR-910]|nr:glutathione S-transferase [Marasmius fiardii PR-910]
MVLKIYGHPLSTCGKRVATVLYEKKIPYEFHVVDIFKGEHKTPEFLENNPFGQIPYIDDDGFIVYESRAIMRYLASKYEDQGPKLIPDVTDRKATSVFEQAASAEQASFDTFASKAAVEVLQAKFGLKPALDKAAFDGFVESLEGKLKAYEAILGKQKYLAGNELTIVDLFHLPHFAPVVENSDILSRQGPNVTRWWNEISSRPSWKAVKDEIPLEPTF